MATIGNPNGNNVMVVVINGELMLEYDRSKSVTERQQQYLVKMDQDMDNGISLLNENIDSPDKTQRAKFVANHLVRAYKNDDDQQIAALCAYLAKALPGLTQVRVDLVDEKYNIDLKFDEVLENQVKVSFPPLQ